MPVATRGDLIREHALSSTYTLTIDGLADPSSHATLQGAIDALAEAIRSAPIRPDRSEAYLWLISADGGADRVLDFIQQDGRFQLRFIAAGRRYTAVIR
ncbi:hypothetical protein ACGFZP_05020 [Kitasatospora sp. NPDC048239]|uniref:hypothetical protein n=1 Tax=Kitasatospora sp. NPDC048239 TaxID=3364046 RepID=UPI00371AACE2